MNANDIADLSIHVRHPLGFWSGLDVRVLPGRWGYEDGCCRRRYITLDHYG